MSEEEIKPLLEEDPITQYLIIRSSLSMSAGKSCAQVGHGCQMLMSKFWELKMKADWVSSAYSDPKAKAMVEKVMLFEQWLSSDYRKVVLTANDIEWRQIKEDYPDHILVIDNGLTQVPEGSETCIALFPQYKSNRTATLKKLRALK